MLLNGIRHADGAGHHSGDREGCLRGTRTGVLLQLEDWLENVQGQRVLWLNGLAGTGKSTIAQSFTKITFADGDPLSLHSIRIFPRHLYPSSQPLHHRLL